MYRPVSEMLLSRHGFPPQPLYCHKCGYKTCRQSHWYCTPGNSMRRAFPYCTCTMLRCRSGCAGFSCVFSIHTYWDGCAPTWAVFFGVQCSTNQAKRGGAPIEWMVAECNCQCCWPFTCPVFFWWWNSCKTTIHNSLLLKSTLTPSSSHFKLLMFSQPPPHFSQINRISPGRISPCYPDVAPLVLDPDRFSNIQPLLDSATSWFVP